MRTLDFKGSSNIKSATLEDDGTCLVHFAAGNPFRYRNVTPEMFAEWEKDKSAGGWFHRNIRSKPEAFPVVTDPAAPSSPPPGVQAAPVAIAKPKPATPVAAPAKIADVDCTAEVRRCAQAMYEAYLENSGGLSWDGKQCPTWVELTPAVRSHWCAAAIEASHHLQRALIDRVDELGTKADRMEANLRQAGSDLEKMSIELAKAKAAGGQAPAPRAGDFRPWRNRRKT